MAPTLPPSTAAPASAHRGELRTHRCAGARGGGRLLERGAQASPEGRWQSGCWGRARRRWLCARTLARRRWFETGSRNCRRNQRDQRRCRQGRWGFRSAAENDREGRREETRGRDPRPRPTRGRGKAAEAEGAKESCRQTRPRDREVEEARAGGGRRVVTRREGSMRRVIGGTSDVPSRPHPALRATFSLGERGLTPARCRG